MKYLRVIPFFILAFALLSGCNTVEGFGHDVSVGGKAIQGAAQKAKN